MILKALTFLAISGAIYLAIALFLVASQSSTPRSSDTGLDFSRQAARRTADPQPLMPYTTSGGQQLHYRHYPSGRVDAPLLVLVHGSGWHGLGYDQLAAALAAAQVADVVLPDLRGHGPTSARRGDIDYIGQLEDDLHDLISATARPDQPVSMAGHSSGGGLVIRYAGGPHGSDITSAILLAPFLQYDAPTTRPNSGGWATPLVRRIIGLTMLNTVGIKLLNHLPIIDFSFPTSVLNGDLGHTATRSYSYRINTSYAPRRDYLADIARLPRFLLISGLQDEAFVSELYEPTISPANSNGSYVLLDGVSHLDVIYAPETLANIAEFLK